MKRNELLRYLRSQNCEFIRERVKHSWWFNQSVNKRSAIPRHNEIVDVPVKKICKDPGISPIK